MRLLAIALQYSKDALLLHNAWALRLPTLLDEQLRIIREQVAGRASTSDIAELTGVSTTKLFDYLRRLALPLPGGMRVSNGTLPVSGLQSYQTPLARVQLMLLYQSIQHEYKVNPTDVTADILLHAWHAYQVRAVGSYHDTAIAAPLPQVVRLWRELVSGKLSAEVCAECGVSFPVLRETSPAHCPLCAHSEVRECASCLQPYMHFTAVPKRTTGPFAARCPRCSR
jgi:hypothetical protein